MGEADTGPGRAVMPGKLTCAGVWGGIEDMDREVRAGSVNASLFSSSCDGGKGGDIIYFGVCKEDTLTRVAIADVVGHGQAVSDVSQYMYDALKAHMCEVDSAVILSEVNRVACRQGLKAMTTAAVVGYYAVRGEFYISYAGHPRALVKRADERTWSISTMEVEGGDRDAPGVNLPLAVEANTTYHQRAIPATPGDRLWVYTDGVTEAPNAAGEEFGAQRLLDVLNANAAATLSDLKPAVLDALRRHTGDGLTHDDVTLISMEVRR